MLKKIHITAFFDMKDPYLDFSESRTFILDGDSLQIPNLNLILQFTKTKIGLLRARHVES